MKKVIGSTPLLLLLLLTFSLLGEAFFEIDDEWKVDDDNVLPYFFAMRACFGDDTGVHVPFRGEVNDLWAIDLQFCVILDVKDMMNE